MYRYIENSIKFQPCISHFHRLSCSWLYKGLRIWHLPPPRSLLTHQSTTKCLKHWFDTLPPLDATIATCASSTFGGQCRLGELLGSLCTSFNTTSIPAQIFDAYLRTIHLIFFIYSTPKPPATINSFNPSFYSITRSSMALLCSLNGPFCSMQFNLVCTRPSLNYRPHFPY